VVLLVPPPLDAEIDALRRACGDRALRRVASHVTLIAPVNVREEDVSRAVGTLRAAAAGAAPVAATLGPPATFAPVTPVLHLPVGGPVAVAAMDRLQGALRVGPLGRPAAHPFVPHVTLADGLAEERLAAALVALADYTAEATFDRVTLLQEEVGPEGRRWRPVGDAPLAPAHVVGRGGLPVELTSGTGLDPEGRAFSAREWPPVDRDVFGPDWEPRAPFAVTARREGEVVGIATGWTFGDLAWLSELLVGAVARHQGVGDHLLRVVEHVAAGRGCRRMGLRAVAGEPAEALYLRRGWREEARFPGWWYGRDVVQLGRDVA
jgi:2'-5' RNA ligase/GNAT superfamily N-acetyltransferase